MKYTEFLLKLNKIEKKYKCNYPIYLHNKQWNCGNCVMCKKRYEKIKKLYKNREKEVNVFGLAKKKLKKLLKRFYN